MSHETSPSTQQPYGIARVTRVWQVPRSTVSARRDRRDHPSPAAKRGPKTPWTDAVLTAHIRTIIAESPFHGEGHRKMWAPPAGAGPAHLDAPHAGREACRRLARPHASAHAGRRPVPTTAPSSPRVPT